MNLLKIEKTVKDRWKTMSDLQMAIIIMYNNRINLYYGIQ